MINKIKRHNWNSSINTVFSFLSCIMLILSIAILNGCNGANSNASNNSDPTVMLDTANGSISNGATNVSITPSIVLKFSEAMDLATINNNTIKLNPVASLKIISSTDNKVFGIKINDPLQENTKYKIDVLGVKSQSGKTLSGTFYFTTGDFTAPTVSILQPSNGATNISVSPSIQIQFSEAVTGVNTTNITIHKDSTTGTTVPINSITVGSNNVYTFSPSQALSEQTPYYVVFGSGIKDSFNNALTATNFSFTTGDFTAPTVEIINPNNNANEVSRYTNIQIRFSKKVNNVNETTIQLFQNSVTSSPIPVSIRAQDFNNFIITPINKLNYNGVYFLSVSDIIDDSGNKIMPVVFSFATKVTPLIDNNKLNIIFVQSMENGVNNLAGSLSIKGLNHSLLFGQFLYSLMNANLQMTFATTPNTDLITNSTTTISYPNTGPLQSIENYDLLYEKDHRGEKTNFTFSPGNNIVNGVGGISAILNHQDIQSITNTINSIISNNNSGNFIFAAPAVDINAALSKLNLSNKQFSFTPIKLGNYDSYIVLTADKNKNLNATTYSDDINSLEIYPTLVSQITNQSALPLIPLNSRTPQACQALTNNPQITYQTPSGVKPTNINTNEIVYLIRHVEAHPANNIDVGNYVCMGQWRALGRNDRLREIIANETGKAMPDFLYANSPIPSINGYMRPLPSINSFGIKFGMPINLPNFNGIDPPSMARFIFTHDPSNPVTKNNPFSGTSDNPKVILLSWESYTGTSAILDLIHSIYGQNVYNTGNYPFGFPALTNGYDDIFKIQLDNNGRMTFTNSCQGIQGSGAGDSNPYLSGSCPVFNEQS